jgi:hypothetical protein
MGAQGADPGKTANNSDGDPPPRSNVTLTDFLYAIVVGAAFQNIRPPLLSDANALIAISFLLILDDWILYHVQAAKLGPHCHSFGVRLALDVLVLLLWYGAAVQATVGLAGVGTFLIVLSLYYFATGFWEFIFLAETQSRARLWCDLACGVFLAALAGVVNAGLIGTVQLWELSLLLPLFALRMPAWRALVFRPGPGAP